ncbi:CSC1-like protein 2 isoform X2 [Xenia sp. Carnegie-2017]|uniref:CSC1-like protein 2 isoform X2 n=1 Tax=Xenia sp. Carnegie-2017 TaxID=2897299 RepID=UPI001F033536|nr:CSC1-like protein 2 isoform X2 [Xenia sp. Carnegie-2017]
MYRNVSFSCSQIYNITGKTYDVESSDGGIPDNLAINFSIWLIVLCIFCVIRRWAWDYGRLALVQSKDKGWAKLFFGKTEEGSNERLNINDNDADLSYIEDVQDKGLLKWILVVFRLSEKEISQRSGNDAIHYLNFQRCLIYYTVIICVLSMAIILPVNHSGDNVSDKNGYSTTTLANLAPDSNIIWLHTVFAFLYLVILIVMVWKFSQGYETDSDPLSQLTVLVCHVVKNASKDVIKQHFEENYGRDSVSNIQFAYDINKLKKISRQMTAASLGRNIHVEYLVKHGQRRDTQVSISSICPFCPCMKTNHDGVDYFTSEEERFTKDFFREKEIVLQQKRLRIMFVTFSRPSLVVRCVKDYSLLLGGNYSATSMSTVVKSCEWTVEHAPAPGNIIWENLSSDPKYWWIRATVINLCLFIFVLFFTTPAILLAGWNKLKSSLDSKVQSPSSPFFSQFLPTLLLWIFTAILPSVVSWSSYYECQWTRTQQEKSVMFKVFIFLLCMIIVLPSLALTSLDALFEITIRGDFQSIRDRMGCVFLPDSGAFFVNYIITSALIGTALELLRIPELVVYGLRMYYTRTEGERLLEAVVEFPFGIQYAWMIAIYSIIIIYSIACPLVVPFGLLYLLLKHFVDRYNLFFIYRPPAHKYTDRSLHNTAIYFLISSAFLLLFCILFYCIIRLGIKDPQTIFALVIFLITLTLFIGKVCFGWFASYSIFRRSNSLQGQEEIPADSKNLEAYLPPVLQSSYCVREVLEERDTTNLRRRHYGSNDHVIDSDNLKPPSDDVIVEVPVDSTSAEEH